MNYRDHVAEMGVDRPPVPAIFTKFPACLTGPDAAVALPSATTDWEVELVAVISRRAYRVPRSDASRYIAGYTIGQDISERTLQTTGSLPQFSLGKSFPGFGPIGPWVVTLDEFDNPDDLALRCSVSGTVRQEARTSQLIRPVAELIESLSAVCPLLPGDILFTGTPAGVGMALDPPCYLKPGDRIESTIEGIGTLVTTAVEKHDDAD
jgi:2-keto-4-pentenoate hydratase/2-oxohepta-3-ene-1,7-dioic acid hydratase in catechol pathway